MIDNTDLFLGDDAQDDPKKKKKPLVVNGTEFEEEQAPKPKPTAKINASEFEPEPQVATQRQQKVQKQVRKPLSFEEQQKIYDTADVNSAEFKDVDAFWKQRMPKREYNRVSKKKTGKWTPDDETLYQNELNTEFLNDSRRIRQARRSGQPLSPQDEQLAAQIDKIRADRRQARMQPYTDESGVQQKSATDQFKEGYKVQGELREGLFGGNNVVQLNKAEIPSQSVTPDADKVGSTNTVKGFSGKALIDADRLRPFVGEKLQETAAKTYAGFVGFDEDEQNVIVQASKELFGSGDQFINRDTGRGVEDVEDLIDSGNYIAEGDKDFIEYSDPDARLTKLGLLARLDKAVNGSMDTNRIKTYWQNFEKSFEDRNKQLDEQEESAKAVLRGEKTDSFLDKVGNALWSVFGTPSEGMLNTNKVLQDTLAGYGKTSNIDPYFKGNEEIIKLAHQLTQIEDYKYRAKQQSFLGELSKRPDYGLLMATMPILGVALQNEVDSGKAKVADITKYLPNTQKLTEAGVYLGLALTPAVGIPITTGLIEENLRTADPTTYNIMLATSIFTMGAGKALGGLRPQLGSAVVGTSQIGLGAAQSGVNYAVNWQNYQNPDGSTNYGLLAQDLFIDIAQSGFDFAEAPMIGKVVKNKFDPEPHRGLNMIIRNSETGKVGMLVEHPETKILQFREINNPEKVASWEAAQKEAGNQYIIQEIDPIQYDNLISKNGIESVRDSFKQLLYGTDDPEALRSIALKANKRDDVTSDLGKSIIDSNGDVQKIMSDARVAKRINQLPVDEDRAYVALKILNEGGKINVNTNLIGGDDAAFGTIRSLQDEGLVKIAPNGEINVTNEGRQIYDYYQKATEGFQKEVETQKNTLGTGKNLDMSATNKYFEGNNFVSHGKRTQKTNMSELVSMGDAQRKALAFDVAQGRADFNSETGRLQNTDFTHKILKQTGDVTINFGREGELPNLQYKLAEAVKVDADGKKANGYAQDIAKLQGLEPTPENLRAIRIDAEEEFDRVNTLPVENKTIKYQAKEEPVSEKEVEVSDVKQDIPKPPKSSSMDNGKGQKTAVPSKKNFKELGEKEDLPKADIIYVKDNQTGKVTTFTREPKFGQYRSSETSGFFPLNAIAEQVRSGNHTVATHWMSARLGAKAEYHTHTSAVNQNLVIPKKLTKEQAKQEFRSEADILNMALFNKTAEDFGGNQRDWATAEQLLVLENLQTYNADLIKQGKSKAERLVMLNERAIKDLTKLSSPQGKEAMERSRDISTRQNYWDTEQPPKKPDSIDVKKLFGKDNATEIDEVHAKRFVEAIKNGDMESQAQALRMILGKAYDDKPEEVVRIYNEAVKVLHPELNTASNRISELYNKAKELLNLPVRTTDSNNNILNHYSYLNNKGTLHMEDGSVIKLGEVWNTDSDAHGVAGAKNTFYANEQFIELVGAIRRGNWYAGTIQDGFAESKGIGKTMASRIARMLTGGDFGEHPNAPFWKDIAANLSPTERTALRDYAEFLHTLSGNAYSVVKLDPDSGRLPFSSVETNVRHENIHKAIIEKTGTTANIFHNDDAVLRPMFATPEGQIVLRSVSDSAYRYAKNDLTVLAHEILAVGSSAKQVSDLFNIKTDAEVEAYAKMYVNILMSVKKALGDDVFETIQKYTDPKTKELVQEALANDEYIKQNRLELDADRYEVARRERARRIAEVSAEKNPSQLSVASIASRNFEGSGWKDFNIRRLTRSGNPYDLTNAAGAETAQRKREGAKPTLNFYIQRPDGTYVYEPDFNSPVYKHFDATGYFNLIDMALDHDALTKYMDWSFPRFQEWAEAQGYHGFFNSNPDMADAFRFRMSLFDNVDTRQLLSGSSNITEPELAVRASQNAIGLYSTVEETLLQDRIPNKAKVEDYFNLLKSSAGVKQEELDWMGFPQYVESNKNKVLSKSDVLEFVADNALNINETKKLGLKDVVHTKDNLRLSGLMKNPVELLIQPINRIFGFTKPDHWSEQDVLVHVRGTERNDAQGIKSFNVEEIQSDPHQQGASEGYIPDISDAIKNWTVDIESQQQPFKNYNGDMKVNSLYVAKDKDGNTIGKKWLITDEGSVLPNDEAIKLIHQAKYDFELLDDDTGDIDFYGKPVPNMPFKTSWQELGFKRALRYAVENNFDQITWTTGRQQIDRYSTISRMNVDEFHFNDESGAIVLFGMVKGDIKTGLQFVSKDLLEQAVGKKLADQIWEQKNGIIKGDDLSIGGQYFKYLYDQKLPKFAEKYVKKWGGKVDKTQITTGREEVKVGDRPSLFTGKIETAPINEDVWRIKITPEMRESVLQGQPLFAHNMKDWADQQSKVKDSSVEHSNNLKKIYRTPAENLTRSDVETVIKEGMFSAIEAEDLKALKKDLDLMGYRYKEVTGQYTMDDGTGQAVNPSLLVYYHDAQSATVIQYLGNKYNQESVFHGAGGKYRLEYNDGSTRVASGGVVEPTGRKSSFDGTYIETTNGKLRFNAEFDWMGERTPAPQDYSLKNAKLKFEAREKYRDSNILTPEDIKQAVEGRITIEGIDGNRAKTDVVSALSFLQNAIKEAHPDWEVLQKPDRADSKAVEAYNIKRSERYLSNIQKILAKHYSDDAAMWYSNADEFAKRVGRDIKDVNTDMGKLWLYLTTAVTSPNTSVDANAKFATNAIGSLIRFYESGKLFIPKFQYDNNGNVIPKADGTAKKLGLGSAQLEKIELMAKGYVPADTQEGWTSFDSGAEVKQGKDLLDNSIAPKTHYIKSPELEQMIKDYGELNGIINYLISPSSTGKKVNKAVDVFGDKLGAFMSNMMGMTQIPTIDTWMNRYFMTLTGEAVTVERKKNGEIKKIKDFTQNFDAKEGDFFRGVVQKAAEDWNKANPDKSLTPADVQAILWTQTKDLFNSLVDMEQRNVDFVQAYDQIKSNVQQTLFEDHKTHPLVESNPEFVADSAATAPKVQELIAGDYRFTHGDRYFIENRDDVVLAVASKGGKDTQDWDIDTSDDLLAAADFDAWVALASRHIANKGLTEPEIQKIYNLAGKGDVEGLTKFVVGLNFRSPIELLAAFLRVNPLVGVKNFLKNSLGNTGRQVAEEVARIPAFMLDMAFSKMSEDGTRTITAPNPVAIMKALGKASTVGMKLSYEGFIQGAEDTNFEHASLFREKETRSKILDAIHLGWVGKIVTKPLDLYTKYGFRLQNSFDIPFRTFAYFRMLDEVKTLRSKELGIPKKEIESHLTTEDYAMAYDYSLYMAFQGKNWVADKYYGFREGLPPVAQVGLDLTVPYVKTPLNVMGAVLDFSGIYPAIKGINKAYTHGEWTDLKGLVKETLNNPEDRQAISYAIGRGMVGWAIAYMGFRLASEGLLAGFFDKEDKKERDDQAARGTGYGTVEIGGYSLDIASLSPVAFFLLSGAEYFKAEKEAAEKLDKADADYADILEKGKDATPEEQAKGLKVVKDAENASPKWSAIAIIAQNMALQTPIISQMVQLVDENMDRWKRGQAPDISSVLGANRLIPAIVQETAKTVDKNERVIDTSSAYTKTRDTVKSGIPVVREELPVKYDMLGRPIEAPVGFDPFKTKKVKVDSVLDELKKAGVTIAEDMKLPAIERNAKRKEVGEKLTKVYKDVVEGEIYDSLPQKYKTDVIREIKKQLTDKYEKPSEDDQHNVQMIAEKYNILNILETNPHSLSKDRVLTDKEALRDAAALKITELSFSKILSDIPDYKKFLTKNFRYYLQSGQKSLTEAIQNTTEFNADPELAIIKWYLSDKEFEARRQRLDPRKDELIKQGKTAEEIKKIQAKDAAKQRVINKRNKVSSIIMKRDRTRENLMKGRQSENIEDRRIN